MRYFRIVYEKREGREVWIEIDESKLGDDDIANSHTAMQVFWDNFEQYDSQSDDHDGGGRGTEVLTVDEIDENGDEI